MNQHRDHNLISFSKEAARLFKIRVTSSKIPSYDDSVLRTTHDAPAVKLELEDTVAVFSDTVTAMVSSSSVVAVMVVMISRWTSRAGMILCLLLHLLLNLGSRSGRSGCKPYLWIYAWGRSRHC